MRARTRRNARSRRGRARRRLPRLVFVQRVARLILWCAILMSRRRQTGQAASLARKKIQIRRCLAINKTLAYIHFKLRARIPVFYHIANIIRAFKKRIGCHVQRRHGVVAPTQLIQLHVG